METAKNKFLGGLHAFSPRGGVVVALSGGADSVCLLDLFISAKDAGHFPYPIVAAHLNHALRGEESDRDEQFCKDLCKHYGIYFFISRVDVQALAKASGRGIEEEARCARYEFLQGIVDANADLCYIATAHNKDDFCETILLNLVRGSGLSGLCSIPKQRGKIIRPLLEVSRAEILAYNNEKKLSFVTDSTNADTTYSRNRIRLKVFPELAEISAGYADSMARTAALLRRDADYLDTEAKKLYTKTVSNGVLYTKSAQNFHVSMLSRIVKMLYNDTGFLNLAEVHIDAICAQILSGKENFMLSLPESFALCERGELRFVRTLPKQEEFCLPVTVGTPIMLPRGRTVLLSETPSHGAVPLRADALRGGLTVRNRRPGDTITVFGKTHKIKRMIADKKCTEAQKADLFFLCSDGVIVYTNLPATADCAFTKAADEHCIFITVKETL